MKKFNIIVAYSKNKGIGYNNTLPWPKIKKDMSRFVNITTNTSNKEKINAVIMGRKTWDSIPDKFRPFKNRLNIIISGNPLIKEYEKKHNTVKVFDSFESAHKYTSFDNNIETIYAIGGEQLYGSTINNNNLDKIIVTELDLDCKADKFFPDFDQHKFSVIEDEQFTENNINMRFKTFKNQQNILSEEYQYINLINDILINGEEKSTRNALVKSVFGVTHVFDLQKGFPLLTTKKVSLDNILKELTFFIRGDTDSKILESQGVGIWKGNTSRDFLDGKGMTDREEGDMGPMYGSQWRHFGATYINCKTDYTNQGTDQLYNLITSLVNDPNSRRHLLTTYDPSKVDQAVLAPCHGLTIQFNVREGKYLDCQMYQRSVDVGLGYPYNIASYALFVHIICHVIGGYIPGKLIMVLGDTHIYSQHYEQLKQQTIRSPLFFPKLEIIKDFDAENSSVGDKIKFMETLTSDGIKLVGYTSYPVIRMQMIA